MAKLVLLVVAAAWAAVLIPPMLRSRVDNRPNSSVTDFRRQLNKLQSTATPPRGSVRAMGRPLAQSSSPLMRQAAGGRPGQPARGGLATRQRPSNGRSADASGDMPRLRSHGDATGGQRRPQQAMRSHDNTAPTQRTRRPQQARRPEPMRAADPNAMVKRRRMNVLFILAVTTASTMFLAATTSSTVMQVIFALSFLSLCGYMYLLAQLRERDEAAATNGWLAQR